MKTFILVLSFLSLSAFAATEVALNRIACIDSFVRPTAKMISCSMTYSKIEHGLEHKEVCSIYFAIRLHSGERIKTAIVKSQVIDSSKTYDLYSSIEAEKEVKEQVESQVALLGTIPLCGDKD